MSQTEPENNKKDLLKQLLIRGAKRAGLTVLIAGVLIWGISFLIGKVTDAVSEPIERVTRPIGQGIEKVGEAIDKGAENFVETVAEPQVRTRSWELSEVDVIGDLHYDPIECPALAEVVVNATLVETHGRAIFFTDSDTFKAAVPVKVRPCIYLDAVSESADGTVITVDLSQMHFEPDPEAVLFMSDYLKNDNPGNEGGIERLAESGWMAPFLGMFQGLVVDPERTEISGLLIAIGESAAANSTCISAMLDGVREYTIQFYQDQAARQGREVEVKLIGEPDIYQNEYLMETLLEAAAEKGVDFDVKFADVSGTCEISFQDK